MERRVEVTIVYIASYLRHPCCFYLYVPAMLFKREEGNSSRCLTNDEKCSVYVVTQAAILVGQPEEVPTAIFDLGRF